MALAAELQPGRANAQTGAHLDDMHVGDINGALGTIRREDTASR